MTTTDMPNVALLGKAGAGKTTAAEFLQMSFGYTPIHFAAPLKAMAALLWGEEARKDRYKLQELGKAVRRIDEDAFVKALLRSRYALGSPRFRYTVDDCRFPNELWKLREEGFTTVRIVAPEELRIDRLLANGKLQDVAQLRDESETALDGVDADYTVDNTGDLIALHDELVRALNREAART